MIHAVKITPEYFEACTSGKKTFEVRRNDRPYMVGDFLALNEWKGEDYTGRCALFAITYILEGSNYCKTDYITMSIVPCSICRLDERLRTVCDIVYDREAST